MNDELILGPEALFFIIPSIFAFLLLFLYVLRSPEERAAEKLAKNP
jgi:hypothetical protein